jgi:nucleoid-associated protein YgaU
MSRYDSAKKGINSNEFYEEFREDRNVKRIEQYRTPVYPKLTAKVRQRFTSIHHIWATGDTLWKLASKHYADPKLWWLLAWYNEKPTESHFEVGGTVLIPTPVEEVISYFHFGV